VISLAPGGVLGLLEVSRGVSFLFGSLMAAAVVVVAATESTGADATKDASPLWSPNGGLIWSPLLMPPFVPLVLPVILPKDVPAGGSGSLYMCRRIAGGDSDSVDVCRIIAGGDSTSMSGLVCTTLVSCTSGGDIHLNASRTTSSGALICIIFFVDGSMVDGTVITVVHHSVTSPLSRSVRVIRTPLRCKLSTPRPGSSC
jgi:hypothetical protein